MSVTMRVQKTMEIWVPGFLGVGVGDDERVGLDGTGAGVFFGDGF